MYATKKVASVAWAWAALIWIDAAATIQSDCCGTLALGWVKKQKDFLMSEQISQGRGKHEGLNMACCSYRLADWVPARRSCLGANGGKGVGNHGGARLSQDLNQLWLNLHPPLWASRPKCSWKTSCHNKCRLTSQPTFILWAIPCYLLQGIHGFYLGCRNNMSNSEQPICFKLVGSWLKQHGFHLACWWWKEGGSV